MRSFFLKIDHHECMTYTIIQYIKTANKKFATQLSPDRRKFNITETKRTTKVNIFFFVRIMLDKFFDNLIFIVINKKTKINFNKVKSNFQI